MSEPKRRPRPLLECHALTKDYGSTRALGPIDLEIGFGETVALVGHNGSGKSTLLSLIAGFIEATDGWVAITGGPAGDEESRATVSYVPDTPVFYDDLSLGEHLEYLSRLHGTTPAEQHTDALLEAFGLEKRIDDLPTDFSRGLRQKAGLTVAVCRPYRLLLIDEPFSGLDAKGKQTLLDLLAQVKAGGGTVIVATHDDAVMHAFDRVITLAEGELVSDTGAAA